MPETDIVPIGSTQPASNPAGVDIDSLLKPPPGVAEGLADIQRDKSAETDKTFAQMEQGLDRDTARINKTYEATGVGPDQLKPWNAEQKSREFRTDPLVAFSSLGSVFGIVASAFTHAPMENALNASAAAMNAIKAGDDKNYERAHQAWKENMDLVMKRHQMMRESYQDATTLMKTNMAAGEAKLAMLAAKYGDKKTQFLLENGMSEDLFKLQAARNKQITDAYDSFEKINKSGMQQHFFEETSKNIDENTKGDHMSNAAQKLAAFNRIYGVKDTAEQQAIALKMAEKAKNGKLLTSDDIIQIHKELQPRYGLTAGGNTGLTIQRQNAAAADAYAKQLREDNPDMQEAEIQERRAAKYKELTAASSAPSGNRIAADQGRVNQIKYSVDAIDKVEALLKKHNALTGLGGKVTRPAETLASVFGSNETDRHEFESLISEIKEWAPRLLTDSQGRPLSAEAGNIDKIVRGLNLGDTTKITAERLLNLKKLYQQMSADTQSRMRGTSTPGKPVEPVPQGDKVPSWKKAPLLEKRSEVEADEQAA